jgi:hypothetical protein
VYFRKKSLSRRVLHKVTWKKHIFYEKKERLNYKLKETLLGDGLLFLNYSKLIRITLHLSILRMLTRAFILLSQIRHQSTKRTLYVTGECVVPINNIWLTRITTISIVTH